MFRILLILIFLISPLILKSQVLELKILNDESNKISSYSISINNKLKVKTLNESTVFLNVTANDTILVEHANFKFDYFVIPNSITVSDTLRKIMELSSIQILEEVKITYQKYENVSTNKNENIIDYFLYPDDLLILLTKTKNNYYLKLKKVNSSDCYDSLIIEFSFSEIYRDPLGNFFLLGKKNAQQFNIIDEKFYLFEAVLKSEFDNFILPLISRIDDLAVFETWSDHNQRYSLIVQNQKSKLFLFDYFDSKKFENASYHYKRAVDYYMQITHEKDNVILMGIWDGNLMTLCTHPNYELEMDAIDPTGDLIRMTAWSDKIASKKLKINTFDLLEYLVILNAETNSMHIINKAEIEKLKISKVINFDFSLTNNYFLDYFYDNLFMFDREEHKTVVYRLDIEKGSRQKIAQITDFKHPENIKVIDNKVYFSILDENQYTRVLRVK
jgi:hypothetical protein